MGGYQSDDFIIFLTKSVLQFCFCQIPYINDSILMSRHHMFLHAFIILPQMFEPTINHEKTASCNLLLSSLVFIQCHLIHGDDLTVLTALHALEMVQLV